MNKLVLIGAAAATALAIGVPVGMTMANNSPSIAEMASLDSSASRANVATANAREAENRADVAEARAQAAEAKAQCERDRQAASNRGAVVGGITGAVIGSQVAGSGAKSEGAVIGGVGGVLAGRQIAKKDHRC
jgi:uncharacterized protein YcfJ